MMITGAATEVLRSSGQPRADPALKEEAIARTAPLGVKPGRYRPSDTLLAFLDGL
jgi:hypothetical protein